MIDQRELIKCYSLNLHNLKSVDVSFPKNKFVVITGVSGSGKSTLAFDIIAQTGQNRYMYAIDEINDTKYINEYKIEGLIPVVSVSQNIKRQTNTRSTVGSRMGILKLLQSVFAQVGMLENKGKELSPSVFSVNSALGMCYQCFGRGKISIIDEQTIFRELMESQSSVFNLLNRNLKQPFKKYCKMKNINPEQPYSEMPTFVKEAILFGDNEVYFKGVFPYLRECCAHDEEMSCSIICPYCMGSGLRKESLDIKILGKNIFEYRNIGMAELYEVLQVLIEKYRNNKNIVDCLLSMTNICRNLCQFNLEYLTMDRRVTTLSGGEYQRLLICSYFNIGLENLLYVFDEPTLGLHVTEKRNLLEKIKQLSKGGNTVIVVEHDDDALQLADYIIEMGVGGGTEGGNVIFSGDNSTYFRQKKSFNRNNNYQCDKIFNGNNIEFKPDKYITLHNVTTYNLKNISVTIPLNGLIGVAGVSGSGKSALISHTMVPLLLANNHEVTEEKENLAEAYITNDSLIQKTIYMSQKPIGRNKKSIVASYLGIMDQIRAIYVAQAKKMGRFYKSGDFSFNSEGACTKCAGEGSIIIAGVSYTCDVCNGSRFKPEIMDILFHGLNIVDILNVTIQEATDIFKDQQGVYKVLKSLCDLGLGYLTLGQSTKSISGGEAQRIKLAIELNDMLAKDCMYVLDEPSAGLNPSDIDKLMVLLKKLVQNGNTVIIIEHDIQMLTSCDWIIEMGPHSGENGGRIISEGPLKKIMFDKSSVIGKYFKEYMEVDKNAKLES